MAEAPPQKPLVRLRRELDHLRSAEKRVATFCLEHPADIVGMTVSELAESSGSSAATVVRLCQGLGFSGFTEFKITLAGEVAGGQSSRDDDRVVYEDVAEGDPPDVIVQKVFRIKEGALADTRAVLDAGAFAAAVDAIATSRTVRFLGMGGSAQVAMDAVYQFQQFGIDAAAVIDAPQMEIAALAYTSDVAVVAISHWGAAKATVDAVEEARRQGAKTVGITSYPRSPLAEAAEITLTVAANETSFRFAPTAGRIAHLVTLDALIVAVANRDAARHAKVQQRAAEMVARHSR